MMRVLAQLSLTFLSACLIISWGAVYGFWRWDDTPSEPFSFAKDRLSSFLLWPIAAGLLLVAAVAI